MMMMMMMIKTILMMMMKIFPTIRFKRSFDDNDDIEHRVFDDNIDYDDDDYESLDESSMMMNHQ